MKSSWWILVGILLVVGCLEFGTSIIVQQQANLQIDCRSFTSPVPLTLSVDNPRGLLAYGYALKVNGADQPVLDSVPGSGGIDFVSQPDPNSDAPAMVEIEPVDPPTAADAAEVDVVAGSTVTFDPNANPATVEVKGSGNQAKLQVTSPLLLNGTESSKTTAIGKLARLKPSTGSPNWKADQPHTIRSRLTGGHVFLNLMLSPTEPGAKASLKFNIPGDLNNRLTFDSAPNSSQAKTLSQVKLIGVHAGQLYPESSKSPTAVTAHDSIDLVTAGNGSWTVSTRVDEDGKPYLRITSSDVRFQSVRADGRTELLPSLLDRLSNPLGSTGLTCIAGLVLVALVWVVGGFLISLLTRIFKDGSETKQNPPNPPPAVTPQHPNNVTPGSQDGTAQNGLGPQDDL